jgi:small subunit ribosomal protein S6
LKRYEGMFLFDSSAARDWAAIEQEVHRLCNRIGAELLVCIKFDERKLAFEIKRRKRGTYVLTYFEAPEERITDLERDAQLSELILRVLVVRAEHVPEEKINELKVWPAETPLQPMAGDGRRHEDGDRWSRSGPSDSRSDVVVDHREPAEDFDQDAAGQRRRRGPGRPASEGFEAIPEAGPPAV